MYVYIKKYLVCCYCLSLLCAYLFCMLSCHEIIVYAAYPEIVEEDDQYEVILVNNEKELRKELADSLAEHRQIVTISYPGIVDRFKKYRKKGYIEFFEYLSMEAGYYAGIVSGYCVNINDDSITFQFNYITTKKQERYIGKQVRKLVKRLKGKTRYEKIKRAHDYLVDHVEYDIRYYNPYYAFKSGRGLCMSYALAFQRILQEMKIPCIYIRSSNHAWNMVKLKGRWYGVDVTWDDSGNTCKYFLKGTSDFYGHKLPKSQCFKRIKMAKKGYIQK